MRQPLLSFLCLTLLSGTALANSTGSHSAAINQQVNATMTKLVKEQAIPGMAVAVIYEGKAHYFTYGLADVEKKKAVTQKTLFELGSLSKTFTGVLGGDSIARGEMRLTDKARQYWPALTAKQWDNVSLLHLVTYSAGGLPLQVPDHVTNEASLLKYYQQWQPTWPVATQRLYSNASIGLFGALTARAAHMDFEQAMQQRVLNPLKLNNTWFSVPKKAQANYAWGYSDGKPRHLSGGALDKEAYGLKSSVEDMATWVKANMEAESASSKNTLQQGMKLSQQPLYQVANQMQQGLGWEMYELPLQEEVVASNSGNDKALSAQGIEAISAQNKQKPYFVHKTGATSGFGGYLAFIPSKNVGIVMLANKNYPNPERVKAALAVLNALPTN